MLKRKAPTGCYWRGNTIWGRVRIKGQLFRWSLHTDDPKLARQRRAKGKSRVVADAYHGDTRRTLGEVLADWEPWISQQVGPKTCKRYAVSLSQLQQYLDNKYLDQIDGKLVAEIIRGRTNKGITNATVKRDLVALSSVMNFAVDQGWIEVNPVLPRMKRLKERRDPILIPDPASLRITMEEAPTMLRHMMLAALATGARQDELVRARQTDVDPFNRRYTIAMGKGNKTRVVDLTPFDGARVFAEMPSHSDSHWVFWHHDGQRYASVASHFNRLSRKLASKHTWFRRFKFHHLRHLHAINWLRSGRSIYDLQQRMGHSSIRVTQQYLAFLTPEEQRQVKQLAA